MFFPVDGHVYLTIFAARRRGMMGNPETQKLQNAEI